MKEIEKMELEINQITDKRWANLMQVMFASPDERKRILKLAVLEAYKAGMELSRNVFMEKETL